MLLGLLLALLPLRGWAETAMHLAATGALPVASQASALPCHAAMAAHEGAVPDEAASGCPLCALCHGAALCLGEFCTEPEAAASPLPASVPIGHGPPALPLPERPPRA